MFSFVCNRKCSRQTENIIKGWPLGSSTKMQFLHGFVIQKYLWLCFIVYGDPTNGFLKLTCISGLAKHHLWLNIKLAVYLLTIITFYSFVEILDHQNPAGPSTVVGLNGVCGKLLLIAHFHVQHGEKPVNVGERRTKASWLLLLELLNLTLIVAFKCS